MISIEQSAIIHLIGQISLGCMISMIFNVLINTMMRSWVRFRDSLYKDEAYLTHTLPVTKNELYNSKFIQTLIFYFIGFVVILLSLFIVYYSPNKPITEIAARRFCLWSASVCAFLTTGSLLP